jgi:hypothetical protein
MKYFQSFPRIAYKTTEIDNGISQTFVRVVPNMTLRFDVSYQAGSYEWYRIQEHDRPDTLAAQWYGSTRYTWVVLLSNNMHDLYDWPLTPLQFYNYISRKYESVEGARDGIAVASSTETPYQYLWTEPTSFQELVVDKAFYDAKLATTLETDESLRVKTLYDYESELNDKRHNVKRLLPDTFASFVRQFIDGVAQG